MDCVGFGMCLWFAGEGLVCGRACGRRFQGEIVGNYAGRQEPCGLQKGGKGIGLRVEDWG